MTTTESLLSSDERAMILACAESGDVLPRLVYADWLDEHDEPQKALYLRLAAAVLDPAPISASYRHDLFQALADQSQLVPPAWRTTFDPGMRYVCFVPRSRAANDLFRSRARSGRNLRFEIEGWMRGGRVRSDQFSYVYFLALDRGRLALVTRARIREHLPDDESKRRYTQSRQLTIWSSNLVGADEAEPVHHGRIIPFRVAPRLLFVMRDGRRKYPVRLDADGLVKSHGCMNGFQRLAPGSAFLLDAHLNGWLHESPDDALPLA